ncbi:MAG: DNA topoisomerase IV subunit B, partial [Dehalococcoidia bacterium]|nr:DNA topoisomerase IV subunit B [Dehalococcoidia bacterium]
GGYLYIAQPPLYRAQQGRTVRYMYSDAELNAFTKGKTNVNVQRFKGLGEMNADQLYETTMRRDDRTLLQVTVESAAGADILFSQLMGEEVSHRKRFIQQYATQVKNLDV